MTATRNKENYYDTGLKTKVIINPVNNGYYAQLTSTLCVITGGGGGDNIAAVR